jgi:hypothetical protein
MEDFGHAGCNLLLWPFFELACLIENWIWRRRRRRSGKGGPEEFD